MHDGYPDAFDRVVHITQGDISKDIYAGMYKNNNIFTLYFLFSYFS